MSGVASESERLLCPDRLSQRGEGSVAVWSVGQAVLIRCHDEGFAGKTGTVVAVFPSGRCQVAVGPINVLNLPPEALSEVPD